MIKIPFVFRRKVLCWIPVNWFKLRAPGKQSGIFGSAAGASPQKSSDSRGSFVHGKPGKDFTTNLIVFIIFIPLVIYDDIFIIISLKNAFFSEGVPFVRTFEVYPLFERSSPSATAALKYVLYCWVAPKRIDRQRRNSQMIRKHIPLSPPISISGYSLHICQVSQLKIASCTWKDWCNNFFLTRCRSQCHIFTQWHCQCA